MSNSEAPKILKVEEVAAILRRSPKTVSKDMSANPERVPPPFRLPGSKTPLWYESGVYAWLEKVSGRDVEQPKGRGRPRIS